ncbi:monosaccharide ABC transporter substrate-binding protein (CUT2 family) [Bacillus oleivorans]|uniref:Monosaccharide ABC transporter substrate-binding protein (CUT2 family) n=1 Tax=Bacillus oleivorans TaxID=1448271 RepID=A0A285CPI1_9BACI|nr:autoinducer 2 ABC transporter substrate-binding protein [Bacillus oleivorans]SNX69424.1 monosaccharide ABC transporter substrate-binding protein (CUT2 family) [Bacillus oleivorans]
MRKNKLFLAGLLTLIMSIALFGCSSGTTTDSSNGGSSNGGSDDGKYTIATVVKVSGEAWFDRMEEGVVKFGEDTGHEAFQQGPQQADAAQQVQIIEDLIAQQVDAITVVPFSAEALEPVLKKAREAGIVVISHEADGMENVDYNIEAFNNSEYGEFLMDNLAAAMGEEGEYMTTVGSLTSTSHMEWVTAAVKHQEENYPNMTAVVTEVETGDDLQTASEKLREALKAHPNLKGFQGSASTDAPGAALAIEELGLEGKISVVGTSVPSVSGQYIENGSINAITFWDPAEAAYAMNTLAVMILDGKKDEIKDGLDLGIPGYESLTVKDNKYIYGNAYVKVDKENLDEYDF